MSLTPYLSKLMTYHEVHKLSRQGFSIRKISGLLGLNWRTVKRMLAIEDDRDYERYLQSCNDKDKILDRYEDFVRKKLEQFTDTSAAQMHDWLKEHYPDFPAVTSRTVFNFIQWVRRQHNLLRIDITRACELVEETPYGAQAQVDFGSYNLRNNQGTRIKVYFFAMVLSRSRYKYVCFSLQPFTAQSTIEAHERAFSFFQGVPDTLVYDQDRVFMIDENNGDLLLTEVFRGYTANRGFKLHFCRKADPQSKGKIENVIKYIKGNLLYNRPFSDIEVLNQEALAWLARTANELPHSFTQKRPVAEWEIERMYLRPVHSITPVAQQQRPYTVRKDNSISYKGNFYSLPYDTYAGRGTKVLLSVQNNVLIIADEHGQHLCDHVLCDGVGQKVINNDHRRNKNLAITALAEQFSAMVRDKEKALHFIGLIRADKPRYIRDQLIILVQAAKTTSQPVLSEALDYCCSNNIRGAADFKAIIAHLEQSQAKPGEDMLIPGRNPLNNQLPDQALIQPLTSSINDYDLF